MANKGFMAKIKKAPKKDLIMAGICFAGAIGMFIWFLFMLF
jgi:hypothetical protein